MGCRCSGRLANRAVSGNAVLRSERKKAAGFCATYSTYSSYAFETFAKGEWGNGDLNILISNLLCFAGRKIGNFVIDRVNGEM